MDALYILRKWKEYTNYDESQKQFNLLSANYSFHRVGDFITKLNADFDPSGLFAVLYAKTTFESILKETKINVLSFLQDRDILREEIEMWDLFHSNSLTECEDRLIDSLNKFLLSITHTPLIGCENREQLLSVVYSSVEAVVENLGKCHYERFLVGGSFVPATGFCDHLLLYETLAECLLDMEAKPDAVYVAYINCNGTADGYFSFFLKSNGNLISVNERIDEAYAGQHHGARNGRWTESKKYSIFPYHIFSFAEHDYLGYAQKHTIDKSKLSLKDAGVEKCMPMFISLLLLNNRFSIKGIDDIPQKYVDSLLPENLNTTLYEASQNAIIPMNSSALLRVASSCDLKFNPEDVLSGAASAQFDISARKEKDSYSEYGAFKNLNQIFVDLYGEGFVPNTETMRRQALPPVEGHGSEEIPVEFVGTKQRMRMQAYYNVRHQLAEYIKQKMEAEFMAFGGNAGVDAWFYDALRRHKAELICFAAKEYARVTGGDKTHFDPSPRHGVPCTQEMYCSISTGPRYFSGRESTLAEPHPSNRLRNYIESWYDAVDGKAKANIFVTINPASWKELERILGEEVPKFIKGWAYCSDIYTGNHLLDAVDPVALIEHPLSHDSWGQRQATKNYSEKPAPKSFAFTVPFSKRSLNRILRTL